ncbi:MAG TPA: recombinase family protein [Pseudonocardiaceae bacterium]|nr:recombinase family protein [Pseudonocardiaceae bacterium]
MQLPPEDAASLVEQLDCPTCGVDAGSACRTRSGITAIKYHTPRFLLLPALRDAHEVDVPQSRQPGRPWQARPASCRTIRIGYQFDAPRCTHVFVEQVSASVKARPELDNALKLAAGLKESVPGRPVILTVPGLNRLARNTAELIAVAAAIEAIGLRLELLDGPLAGSHDSDSMFFAVLAAEAQLDRDHLREKTREGQRAAETRGHRSGRPKVFDDELLSRARELRDQGMPVPEIAANLTITTGKNAGRHPSVASVYRALDGMLR